MAKINGLKNTKNIKLLAITAILFIINVINLNNAKQLFFKNLTLKADIDKKKAELAGPEIFSKQETVNSEISQLNSKITAVQNTFSSNTEDLFYLLNRFAESSKISLKAISPLEKIEVKLPNSSEVYIELPINIKLECNYFQLLGFLNKMESMDKAILITKFKVQNNPGNVWEHDIELSLKVPISLKGR